MCTDEISFYIGLTHTRTLCIRIFQGLQGSIVEKIPLLESVMRIRAGFFGFGFDLTAKHRNRIRIRIRIRIRQ
jgi:hypothetical protein